MKDQVTWGLIHRTAYEEREIVAVFQSEDWAGHLCRQMNEVYKKAGLDDEEFIVALVVSDTEGWVQEPLPDPVKKASKKVL